MNPVIRSLGHLEGPLLICGGAHSNLQASEALIREAGARGIPPERVIFTGDMVAYCADAVATLALWRDFGCPMIAGNCESQLAAGAEDCACGFAENSVCDRLSVAWYAHADGQIGTAERDWLKTLPDMLVFEHEGRRLAVIHGGVTDQSRFLWPSSDASEFEEEIAALTALTGPVDHILTGHSGVAFSRQIGQVTWTNAGAIGMPPHDGRPETRFAILDDRGVTFERLSYDHQGAAAAMARAGLTQGYDKTLITGIWPSEDILPPELRR